MGAECPSEKGFVERLCYSHERLDFAFDVATQTFRKPLGSHASQLLRQHCGFNRDFFLKLGDMNPAGAT